MTVETKIKVGGAWKALNGAPQVKVGGAWKTLTTIEARVGGSWKEVFSASTPTIVQPDIVVTQTAVGRQVVCGVFFQIDGGSDLVDKDGNAVPRVSGEYHVDEPDSNIGANWDIRHSSLTSGAWTFEASPEGTWVQLSAGKGWWITRTWGKGMDNVGVSNVVGDFEIRDTVTEVVIASFEIDATSTIT